MKVTHGFSFIELMVGLLITSILSIALYQVFRQTQNSTQSIQSLMDYTVEVPVVYNQLEKDLTGLFIPERYYKQLRAAEKKSEQKTAEKKEKKKIKPISHLFYLQKSSKNLELLSFLTTHSLALYNSVVPRNVRVVYSLVPLSGDGEKLYRLVRQETSDIATDLKVFKGEKLRGYDLMTNIKSLSIELYTPEKLPKKAEKAKQQKEEKKRIYRQFTTWIPDEIKAKTEYPVPAFVVVKGLVFDPLTKRDRSFEWDFGITSFDGIEHQLQQIKEPSQQQAPQQKNQQSTQVQQPKSQVNNLLPQKPVQPQPVKV